jgi:hypothetical protein
MIINAPVHGASALVACCLSAALRRIGLHQYKARRLRGRRTLLLWLWRRPTAANCFSKCGLTVGPLRGAFCFFTAAHGLKMAMASTELSRNASRKTMVAASWLWGESGLELLLAVCKEGERCKMA